MWDLGFLIGADRNLPHDEVDSVIESYATHAHIDMPNLMWHKQRWDAFWKEIGDR